jgi:hypothetical protein
MEIPGIGEKTAGRLLGLARQILDERAIRMKEEALKEEAGETAAVEGEVGETAPEGEVGEAAPEGEVGEVIAQQGASDEAASREVGQVGGASAEEGGEPEEAAGGESAGPESAAAEGSGDSGEGAEAEPAEAVESSKEKREGGA